ILLHPPFQQHRKTQLRSVDRPIELRREIVSPSIQHPLSGVAVQLGVGVKRVAGSFRWITRTPDAERADSEFHPWLRFLDPDVYLVDQAVDVGAAPVVARESSTRAHVLPPTRGVGKIHR